MTMCSSFDTEFSRAANPDRQYVEIRPMLPVDLAGWLDAKCSIYTKKNGKKIDRSAMAKLLLSELASRDFEEASVLMNVVGANPVFLDSEQ